MTVLQYTYAPLQLARATKHANKLRTSLHTHECMGRHRKWSYRVGACKHSTPPPLRDALLVLYICTMLVEHRRARMAATPLLTPNTPPSTIRESSLTHSCYRCSLDS